MITLRDLLSTSPGRLGRWFAAAGLTSLAVGFVLNVGGCRQYYSGGLGVEHPDQQRAYEQWEQDQQKLREQQNAPAEPGDEPIDPTIDLDPHGAAGQPIGPASPPRYTVDMARQSIGALGLFGYVEPPAEQRSSMMDGQDNVRRVTTTPEGADFDPAIGPLGQYIYYASTRHRRTADIYRKRIGGSSITQLTSDASNDVMPAISPDGNRIAFASDRAGNWDIYLMDAAGGTAVQLTNSPSHEIHPSFSPDGKRLVFCSFGSPSGQWEMAVIDVDNPSTKKFIGYGLFPNWSPIDNTIVYQRARQRGTRWFSVWSLTLDDELEAGAPTELAASTNAAAITPAWSADGKQVVFCTVINPGTNEFDRPVQADLWIMNADGSGRVQLTSGQFSNLQPTWTSDGMVLFVSDRGPDGVENIYAMRPDGAVRMAQPGEEAPGPSAHADSP